MNTDQIKGKLEQVVGHVKQGVGEALGNDKVANEGLGDQVKGSARETWGNVKDAAQTTSSSAQDHVVVDREVARERASETREHLSDKIRDAKNVVNEKIDEFKATHSR